MSILTRALQPAVNALWRLAHGKQPPVPGKGSGQRSFDAAQFSNLLYSWGRDGKSLNQQLQFELRPLRARSRSLCQNNEYAKNFVGQCKSNIIGPDGVRLQVKARNSDGTLDRDTNNAVERAWKQSGKTREFEVTRRFDRATFERLLVETIARDGEAIVQKVRSFGNKSRYAVRLIDADYLDESYTTDKHPSTGNKVRMGVEIDSYGAPVAYHLRTAHPGDTITDVTSRYERIRIDASEILHIYIPMYADQWRGVPWMHASMIGLRDIGGYREAALVAARVGAAKMGFFKGPRKEQFDGEDSAGDTIMDAEAGSFEHIAGDTEFIPWDPAYPHGDFEPFNKTVLKGIAAGLGISYHKGSGDLEGVNYSSGRLGELSERDMWMMLQNFIICQFHDLLYPEWLDAQLLAGNIVNDRGQRIPFQKRDSMQNVHWQPRRWKWADPQKEFNGIKGQIDECLVSRSQAMRDMGHDPEEMWLEIQSEQQMLESMGITPAGSSMPSTTQGDPDDESSSSTEE